MTSVRKTSKSALRTFQSGPVSNVQVKRMVAIPAASAPLCEARNKFQQGTVSNIKLKRMVPIAPKKIEPDLVEASKEAAERAHIASQKEKQLKSSRPWFFDINVTVAQAEEAVRTVGTCTELFFLLFLRGTMAPAPHRPTLLQSNSPKVETRLQIYPCCCMLQFNVATAMGACLVESNRWC